MTSPHLVVPVSDEDHVIGSPSARVTLLEYGDFECPNCGHAYPIVEAIRQRLGDELRFVFRNFPLQESHPHAERAAESAEAASAQGHFWEMHHQLYEHQNALDDEALHRYAAVIHLDLAKFDAELASGAYAPRVHRDFMSGLRSGVNGTPTFFINGVRFDGPWDDEQSFTVVLSSASADSERGAPTGRGR